MPDGTGPGSQGAEPPPRPIVLVALCLVGGMALGLNFAPPGWFAAALALAAAGIAGGNLWRSRRIRGPRLGDGRWLLLAVAALGMWQGARLERGDRMALDFIEGWPADEVAIVQGVLAEEPIERAERIELVLRDVQVASTRVEGAARRMPMQAIVSVREEAAAALRALPGGLPYPGRSVRVTGRLRPAQQQTNPASFDGPLYSRSQNVGMRIAAYEADAVQLGPGAQGPATALRRLMRAARGAISGNIATHLPEREAGLARALFLGETQWLAPNAHESFRNTGLIHILSVSGLHTAIVLVILFGFARLCGLGPRGCLVFGAVGLLLYLALTGFRPPVMRATVMALFVIGGLALGRVATGLASAGLAAFVTLLIDPRNLLRVDWQLSYVCMLAIVLFAAPLHELLFPAMLREHKSTLRHALNKYLCLPLAVTLAVQMGIIPLQVWHFQQVNLLAPLSNLASAALTFFSVLGAMGTGLLGALPGVGTAFGVVAEASLAGLLWIVDWLATLPGGVLHYPALAWPVGLVYCALLLGGAWLLHGRAAEGQMDARQRAGGWMCLTALVAVLVWAPRLATAAQLGGLNVYVLDVGQGDGTIVRFPNGATMVVDAGKQTPSDHGKLTLAPALEAFGVQRIDCLVATHADADHIGGIPWLLDHFEVGTLLLGPDVRESEVFAALQRRQHRAETVLRGTGGGQLEGFGAAQVRVLGPVEGMQGNDASIVLELKLGECELLLTGDLEDAGEQALLAEGVFHDVEVLKVGHHGSGGSTGEALLAATRPELAVISVGRRNAYGHPAKSVLDRLDQHGAGIARTDRMGALWIATNGRRVSLFRYVGP